MYELAARRKTAMGWVEVNNRSSVYLLPGSVIVRADAKIVMVDADLATQDDSEMLEGAADDIELQAAAIELVGLRLG